MLDAQTEAFRKSLALGGECGRLIASRDWSSTSLGPLDEWPSSLRTATSLLLRSPVPMVMLWGEDGVMIYNDAYSHFAAKRHPCLFGSKVREGWPEVAAFNDNVMKVGLAGETLAYRDQELTLFRHGVPEQVFMNLDYSPVLDESGRPAGVLAVVVETTERVQAERKLRASEARLAAIFAEASVGLSEVSPSGEFLRVNEELCRLLGRGRDELLGLSVAEVTHPADLGRSQVALEQASKTGKTAALDKQYVLPDGTTVWASSRVTRLHDADGATGNLLVVTVDLTDRYAAEERLRASEEFNRRILASSPDCIKVLDLDGRIEFMSTGGMCVMEVDRFCEVDGAYWPDFWQGEDHTRAVAAFEDAKLGGTGRFQGFATTMKGSPRWWDVIVTSINGSDGRAEKLLSVSRDVTATKEAEARLKEFNDTLEQRVAEALSERKLFSDVVESSTSAILVLDKSFNILAINRTTKEAIAQLYGKDPQVGDNLLDLLSHLPEHQAQVRDTWARALAGEEFVVVDEFGGGDRERRYYEVRFSTLKDRNGKQIGAAHTAYDVTEKLRAEAELKAAQEALRQSQKMEAMGQLTGGVAHDFNNLLTPIVGALDMLQRKGLGGEREQRLVAGAMQSAERAKTLVQRLLAFARRQPLQPIAVDIGQLVVGMGDLIESTTGPQIKVLVEAPDDLPPAKADPNQLEMALLNLAVNARDAMADGGTLRISATVESVAAGHRAKIEPGSYVRLSVADTGAGMDEQTVARAVEPFFSTKGVGQGTGLGLSMVHGLVSQLGGDLTIQSRRGLGTNVELWLPVSATSPEPSRSGGEDAPTTQHCGVALLVDDEELVRMSTSDMLGDLGYAVVEATSAEEAMQMIAKAKPFDLIITDHLMPGMSGTDLARAVRSAHPTLPVLLVSGYAEREGIDPDLPRLTKPFRKDELASSIAQLVK